MNVSYRRINMDAADETRFVAEIDVTLPKMYDSDFKADEEIILDRISYFKEKVTSDDFFELALDEHQQIIGFHFVRKVPYLKSFAGSIYTLWVSTHLRRNGIGKELKQRAEQWARNHKLDHLYSFTHANNLPMQSLNKALDFEVVGYRLKKKL